MTPDETLPTASASVVAIVQQAMDDHLTSLIRGDAERVRYDFADEVRERIPELEALVPTKPRSYQFKSHHYDGRASHQVVHIDADPSVELDWLWANIDGRYRVVDVKKLP